MHAAAQNWQLCEVWDAERRKLRLTVLPVDFTACPRVALTQAHVVRLAKDRDPVAMKALHLISKSNLS